MKHGMSLESQLCGQDGAADRPRRPIENPLEKRVLQRSDLVELPDVALDPARGIRVAQCLDVRAVVELEQLLHAGGFAGSKAVVRQPAQNSREVRDGRVADDLQRVIVPERGTPERFAADEDRQRRGRMRFDEVHCLNIVHAFATESG